MNDPLKTHTLANELAATAETLEKKLGTPGGVILAGMLINEGLHAVAEAIRDAGDIEGAIEKIADVIRAQG